MPTEEELRKGVLALQEMGFNPCSWLDDAEGLRAKLECMTRPAEAPRKKRQQPAPEQAQRKRRRPRQRASVWGAAVRACERNGDVVRVSLEAGAGAGSVVRLELSLASKKAGHWKPGDTVEVIQVAGTLRIGNHQAHARERGCETRRASA
jgi:hypothetical protein